MPRLLDKLSLQSFKRNLPAIRGKAPPFGGVLKGAQQFLVEILDSNEHAT
jgi:hypothetical protein